MLAFGVVAVMPLGTEETGKLAGSVMVGRRDIIFAPQLERFCQLRAVDWTAGWRISLNTRIDSKHHGFELDT
jgi:hypothetical protein